MLDQIRDNIGLYVNHFLFEELDEYTIGIMENGIKSYLKELKVFEYELKTTILDKTNLKINLKYDDNYIDFYIGRPI